MKGTRAVNYKQLLKFYFYAEGLNAALDELSLRYAVSSACDRYGWERYADRICALTEAKTDLGELWAFLDGAMSTVTEEDRRALAAYCGGAGQSARGFGLFPRNEEEGGGEFKAEGDGGKAVHRSLMKFSRRVGGKIGRFGRQLEVLREYYCLLGARGQGALSRRSGSFSW